MPGYQALGGRNRAFRPARACRRDVLSNLGQRGAAAEYEYGVPSYRISSISFCLSSLAPLERSSASALSHRIVGSGCASTYQ